MVTPNILEIWKDIENFENWYQVSNMGNVKSLDRVIIRSSGPVKRKGKILKLHPVGELRNYPAIQLNREGLKKNYKVHRLVAMAFLNEPLPEQTEVNHKNGNTFDNRVENLEWCSPSENQIHAIATGLIVRQSAEGCPNTKYKVKVFKEGVYITTLVGTKQMKDFGLIASKVSQCVLGQRKTHKGYTYEAENI